ncbi:Family T1, proteasome alpha subunit, threonine peptidase [Tritrichomonas foetus]|uniref:20S proteasome subunit alpha 1 n=1 Tax=Tritrichomonas foetus TaxID=1144522 RepID=A0A075KK20_9EUKA|nr:20S proteasome subunit alpha 1 [Tritrichomonas foetus]OHT01658.1 Family T1, proteasome alpha subunit, threonine peptidase [Tritrichomonas foetus]|eukprot:OHT01658.1 Family T1, proteasome alpha subunit, threonine peptidase [Tritrichomonas foetus]
MSSSADRFITIFSQEGRLWQVEYAFKAVKQAEVTAIGAKGANSLVVAVQKKVQDKLIDPSTVTHMFRITEHVGACLIGLLPDVLYICRRLRYDAAQFEFKNGFEIPVNILSSRLSEIHQIESQYSGARPTAVSAIIFGFEPSKNDFALYKVEPSGFTSGYRAVSCGVKEVEAMSALEKKYESFPTEKETAEFVISTLQTVVGLDFEAREVEVAVVTRENTAYRVMKADEVEKVLTAVAEKD